MNATKLQLSTSDFKVGHLVEYNGTGVFAAKKGSKAIVTKIGSKYVMVKWLNTPEQGDGGYFPHRFNIIGIASEKQLYSILKNKFISSLEYLEALSEK